nr:DUF6883 domain-containing protein [Oscillochloris trichoides]
MKLPNGDQAYIPPEKLTGYLLSETHMVGQAKARFFQRLGFTSANADLLAAQLLNIAHNADTAILSSSPHGQKYSLIGMIYGPDQRIARVQTIWIIEPDDNRPRFVTAYPA